MKKIFIILFLATLLPYSAFAQDARKRTTTTIVADALAQLPTNNETKYNEVMGELAATGEEGIVQIGEMLLPTDKGGNAVFEYALNGVVDYVSAPDKSELREGVRKGLVSALGRCSDDVNKAFILSLLQMCPSEDNFPVFIAYLSDPYLADWAANGLIRLPNIETQLMELLRSDTAPRAVLAYAVGAKGMHEAEPILLKWLKQSDTETTTAIHKALARCGTAASIRPLRTAAKAVEYEWDVTSATDSYLILLNTLIANGEGKTANAEAKKLIKDSDKANIRGAALHVIFATDGMKAEKYLVEAMSDADREFRVAALREAEVFADEDVYATLATLLAKTEDNDVKEDILNWFGVNKVNSQIDAILPFINDPDEDVAHSAIRAAGEIGGEKALQALVNQLNGKNYASATDALLSFNGDISKAITQALDGDEVVQVRALSIVSKRHIVGAADKVFALLHSKNSDVSVAAYESLAGIAMPSDFERLSALLEENNGAQVPAIQKAMEKAITPLSTDEASALVIPSFQKATNKSRFYPVLAQVGDSQAIKEIMEGYENGNKQEAFAALLNVDNTAMIDVLYNIASADEENASAALLRYNQLVSAAAFPAESKYELFKKALESTNDAAVENAIINSLSEVGTWDALVLVEQYVDKPATAESAAYAIRSIVSQNIDIFRGQFVSSSLEEAKGVLSKLEDPDAGYAVDDINGMLSKLSKAEHEAAMNASVGLSKEEIDDGFDALFDGVSMDGWTGNTVDYVPVDGTIYVTANYGNGGNLYTVKEYSDFILRFDFCFVKEGVNNGVGIRTPMGVDAAYEGMEIQILDHDAPIYKDLRVYQQHGSVYGIIPAKRVKFPALGEWNSEEIRAIGNHITVTVNGEVILDGDIHEACQGHNVSTDGSERNPYTVDHLNHPGLFNKSGHIGFLGHGEGIKFRNIRLKDLSK